jgi:hypothetical protein
VHSTEIADLLERQRGVFNQPNGSGLRHQGLCHIVSSAEDAGVFSCKVPKRSIHKYSGYGDPGKATALALIDR